MIAAGLMRAMARRPLWPLAIAGVAAAPVFLAAPASAGSTTAARTGAAQATTGSPDSRTGAREVTNCGNGVSAVTVRLPAGFDPLTATAAPAGRERSAAPAGRAGAAGRVAQVRDRGSAGGPDHMLLRAGDPVQRTPVDRG